MLRARKHFAREGLEFPPKTHVYAEKQSAFGARSLEKRKRTQALLADLESGLIVGFFTLRVNRFSRNTQVGLTVYGLLHELRAKVVFIENPKIDIFTHAGRKWWLGEQADAEGWSLEHSVRVRDGKDAVAEQGRTNASKSGFGAKKRRGVLVWVKPDALIVRDALTMFHDEDVVCSEIVARLLEKYNRSFTPQQVARWIKAPRYYGYTRHASSEYGQSHATTEQIKAAPLRKAQWRPLVKRSWYADNIAKLWQHAHGGKGAHGHRDARRRHDYIFGGGELLHCVTCGGTTFGEMRLVHNKPRRKYVPGYLCSTAKRKRTDGRTDGRGPSCAARGRAIYESVLVHQVGELIEQIRPPADWVAQIAEHARAMRTDDETLRRQRRAIQRQRDEAGVDLARKRITMEEFKSIADELDTKEARLTQAQPTGISEQQIAEMVTQLASLRTLWRKARQSERRELVRMIFARMWADLFAKRVVRIEARSAWAALLATVPAFVPVEGAAATFAVTVPESAVAQAVRAILAEAGQATTWAMAQHPRMQGIEHKALRLTLRMLRDSGVIEQAGREMLPVDYPKSAVVWRLTASSQG